MRNNKFQTISMDTFQAFSFALWLEKFHAKALRRKSEYLIISISSHAIHFLNKKV